MINLAHRDINRFSGVKYACNSAIHYYKVIHPLFLVQRIKSPTLCLPTCPTSYNSVKLTAYRGHSNQKKAHCHYMKKRWCAPDYYMSSSILFWQLYLCITQHFVSELFLYPGPLYTHMHSHFSHRLIIAMIVPGASSIGQKLQSEK